MKIWWYRFLYDGEGDYQKYNFQNGGSKINFWIITPTGQRPSESFLVFLMIVKTKCSSFPFMLMMLLPTHGEDQQTPQTISQRWDDDDDDDTRARWSLGLRNNLLVFSWWLLYIIMPYSIYSGLIVQIWSKAAKYMLTCYKGRTGPFAQCDSVFTGQNKSRQYFCTHVQISAAQGL